MSLAVRGLWSWWWDVGNEKEKFLTLILTISIPIFMLFWFAYNAMKAKTEMGLLPPGPRGLPLIGYLPFLGSHLHKKFMEMAGVYGPIFHVWMGRKLAIVISSPSIAKEVVRDKDTIFANRDALISPFVFTFGGQDITWCPYGSDWKKMRKVFVREMLSNPNLDACYPLRRREVHKTISLVYNKAGKPVNIGELAFITNINAIISMLWGGTLEGEEGTKAGIAFKYLVAELMELFGKPNISDAFPVLARFDIQGVERQTKKILVEFEKFLDSAIARCSDLITANKAGTQKEDTNDFLRFLLELKENQDAKSSITMTQLKAMLLDIVIGGSDTTSTTVEWAMTELMQHPEAMEKIQQELDEVVGLNNHVEEFHLPKLRYLEAVIKEAFRLHPALPLLIPRSPSAPCTVAGYNIPKGSAVFINVYAIHRDPELWDNPSKFQPERFLNEESSKYDLWGNNFQFLPFGSGRRICAGLPLAEKMLVYQLAALLHAFKWKLPDGLKLESSDKFGIVIKKVNPLVVIPTPRLSNLCLY